MTNFILRDAANPGNVLAMFEGGADQCTHRAHGDHPRGVGSDQRRLDGAAATCWRKPVKSTNLGEMLAAIRRQTTQVRGALDGTMLRNEIYNFARIGTFLERADNTARILDVKYHVLLPSISWVGSALDNNQWETVLRSLSGAHAYRWLNAGQMDARGIAEFLILDGRFPRSLRFCFDKLNSNIESLAGEYGEETPVHALVRSAERAVVWHHHRPDHRIRPARDDPGHHCRNPRDC